MKNTKQMLLELYTVITTTTFLCVLSIWLINFEYDLALYLFNGILSVLVTVLFMDKVFGDK